MSPDYSLMSYERKASLSANFSDNNAPPPLGRQVNNTPETPRRKLQAYAPMMPMVVWNQAKKTRLGPFRSPPSMNMQIPPFAYQRRSTALGLLWSLWLKVPTRLREFIYRPLIRLYDKDSWAIRMPFGVYAKLCYLPDEAYATEFVRTHTTIPVPQVLDVLPFPGHDRRRWLMLSTRLPGTPLFIQGVGHRLANASDAQLARVKEVLAGWIHQLRNIPSPYGDLVGGFLGGPFRSFRVGQIPVGPSDSVAHFHSQVFCTVWPENFDDATPRVQQLISGRPEKPYKIHLVHGDIVLHNILADEELCPTGLIDWECAAWMPEYWETASSSRYQFRYMWCWKDIVRDVFPEYDDDLAIERQILLGYDAD
ncbi:hypothetical protein P691DRAFT_773626 [Macrolepiota fuliginosa MF-IS2]|uniref:Aminoglycoside phosphotransferase domain-containing protein n=1 Tax=Macrolepiota fuliginosa MF-IS2 TaxID=1400762 RepID=A0A9P6C6Y4_9AGAR|nr:hypothetical protein P691DRAFT_773626 [Macrolepiota fuliginosa MF-IS2]